MLITQVEELNEKINEGIECSRKTSKSVLISHVEKIEYIEPLSFFAAGKSVVMGERVFWSESKRNLYFVGLGQAYSIDRLTTNQRFQHVENEWKELLNNHIINDIVVSGTGPILLGGFSFDPLKPKTALWENFNEGKMVLPIFLLTIVNGESWLTINMIVNGQDVADLKMAGLKEQNGLLMEEIRIKKIINSYHNSQLIKEEVKPEQWKNSVRKVTEDIKSKLINKVVLARELRVKMEHTIKVEKVLARLFEEQPSSYIFAIESKDNCFIGASPERLVKKKGDKFSSMCLAGTISRGKSAEEDEKLGAKLLHDKKNLQEHAFVVQMVRKTMEEGCKETVTPEKPNLFKLRDVQHLYMPVIGKAKEHVSLMDMVAKLHPTPALGGFPSDIAVKKIRDEEVLDRGWYAAPVGWIDMDGDGEFAVAIRSGLIQGNSASLFAGCGIVGDSNPETEYQETEMKFKPMLSALGG